MLNDLWAKVVTETAFIAFPPNVSIIDLLITQYIIDFICNRFRSIKMPTALVFFVLKSIHLSILKKNRFEFIYFILN